MVVQASDDIRFLDRPFVVTLLRHGCRVAGHAPTRASEAAGFKPPDLCHVFSLNPELTLALLYECSPQTWVDHDHYLSDEQLKPSTYLLKRQQACRPES